MSKADFLGYLTKKGTTDALWKVLIEIDKRKNDLDDPVTFLRENLDPDLTAEYKILLKGIEEATAELNQLSEEHPVLYAKFLKTKKKKGKKGKKK